MSELLFELMTEEMPPSHVKLAMEQTASALPAELAAAGLIPKEAGASALTIYATSRRLVLRFSVESGQKDREEKVIGPPKAVCFAPDGTLTQAALGFAKARGVDPARLEVFRTEKGEYVGFSKVREGGSAREILPKVLARVLSGLVFPKMMRWGENPVRYSRPIKHILCLLDGQPLDFTYAGLSATNTTLGHKLLAPRKIVVHSFEEYREALGQAKVVIDQQERQRMIQSQAEELLAPLRAQVYPDAELLERLTFDIEHPCVFLGSFPEDYLALPLEVLSTAMKEGQRLFAVVKGKKQLPHFLGVADVVADAKSLIRSGNERVLKARLEDARFFWAQDRKAGLERRAAGLSKVVFQERLGSYEDKAQRLKKLVGYIADKVDATELKKDLVLAAELCKADLLTETVGEFPSLQGRLGGLLAAAEKLPDSVGRAIYEHYQPAGLDDETPASLAGAILSLADKLDSLVGVMGLGIQTTGSGDPFGLRRNANGVCRIILEKTFSISFPRLLDKAIAAYGDRLEKSASDIRAGGADFFLTRLRSLFDRQGFRYDLINAAFGAGLEDIYYSSLRLKALHALRSSPQFEPFILMAKRVNNIIRQQPASKVNPEHLKDREEKELYALFHMVQKNTRPMIAQGDFTQAQRMIFRLQPSLNTFFDKVLVMAEDTKLRRNRLGLLQAISRLLLQVADYSQVVVEGEKSSG